MYTRPAATENKAPSTKQLSFIEALMKNREYSIIADAPFDPDSSKEASELIKYLLSCPRVAPGLPLSAGSTEAPTNTVNTAPSEPGVYLLDNVLYHAVPTRSSGRVWAHHVTLEGKKGDFYGGMNKLTGARKLSLVELSALSIARGFSYCVLCSKLLTDPASIERGLGPVCMKKY